MLHNKEYGHSIYKYSRQQKSESLLQQQLLVSLVHLLQAKPTWGWRERAGHCLGARAPCLSSASALWAVSVCHLAP